MHLCFGVSCFQTGLRGLVDCLLYIVSSRKGSSGNLNRRNLSVNIEHYWLTFTSSMLCLSFIPFLMQMFEIVFMPLTRSGGGPHSSVTLYTTVCVSATPSTVYKVVFLMLHHSKDID